MTYEEFENLIDTIYIFFGKRKFQDETTKTVWFNELQSIPIVAIDEIKKLIFAQSRIPDNIPLFIKKGFFNWKQNNQDKCNSLVWD